MASRIAEKLAAKKAAIYIRVSTHWQVDKDSLKVQRRELIAYVTLVLGITDYVVFEDPGYSAKNTDRPEYQAMMDRIRTGEFTHLVVWKIDRISRNLIDFAAMHDELQSLGVTFVSKNEQFDTSSAIGEAMMRIILIFAELERKTTAERVTAVMLSRASDGQWNGGRVPFGYSWSKETKTFSIVPEEAKAIRRRIVRAVPVLALRRKVPQRRRHRHKDGRPMDTDHGAHHPDEPVVHRPVRLQRPFRRQRHREARLRRMDHRREPPRAHPE